MERLRHIHVVQLLSSYTDANSFSILMAPAANMDLAKYMRTTLMNQESRNFLYRSLGCLANTLRYLHSNSIVHHDLKPANILVSDSRIILADFGLARSFDRGCEFTRATKVTPEYAPPEAIEQRVHSRASDIWSFGCIVAEMLTFMNGRELSDFEKYRSTLDGSKAFFKTRDKTMEWLTLLEEDDRRRNPNLTHFAPFDIVRQMICKNPKYRPTADEVWLKFPKCSCCCDSERSIHRRPYPDVSTSALLGSYLRPGVGKGIRQSTTTCITRFPFSKATLSVRFPRNSRFTRRIRPRQSQLCMQSRAALLTFVDGEDTSIGSNEKRVAVLDTGLSSELVIE